MSNSKRLTSKSAYAGVYYGGEVWENPDGMFWMTMRSETVEGSGVWTTDPHVLEDVETFEEAVSLAKYRILAVARALSGESG